MSAPAAPGASVAENIPNRPHRNRQRRPKPTTQNAERTVERIAERTVGGRRFGGQLTRLHADAPAFVPASVPPPLRPASSTQPPLPQPQSENHSSNIVAHRGRRKVSISRSTAPDIATRTHEDIAKGIYECAICTNEVGRNSKIWSCRTCWTVFHIGCIKTWSKNEGAAVHQ